MKKNTYLILSFIMFVLAIALVGFAALVYIGRINKPAPAPVATTAAPAPVATTAPAVSAPPETNDTCTGIVVNGACTEQPFQNPETARCFDYNETGIENTVTYQFNLVSGKLVIDAEKVDGQFNNGGLLVVDKEGDHTFTIHNGAYCWVPNEHAEWAYAHRLSVLQQFVPNPTIINIP